MTNKLLWLAAAAGGVWYARKRGYDLLSACGWKKLLGMNKDCGCGGCADGPEFSQADIDRLKAGGWTMSPVNSSEVGA